LTQLAIPLEQSGSLAICRKNELRIGVYYATYGHWTQALKQAGYTPVWHTQPNIADPNRCDSLATILLDLNFPDISLDVTAPVDFICGSPPCIGLSGANPKASPDHWANKNFVHFFATVEGLQPKAFLVEIVPQIFTRGKKLLDEALAKIPDYFVSHNIFQVAEYGSPAKRNRAYFLGVNMYKHGPSIEVGHLLNKSPYLSCSKVLEPVRAKWDAYAPDRRLLFPRRKPTGEKYNGPYSCLIKCNRKLKADEPAFTITGTTYENVTHYGKDRFLSVEEQALLMGFPPSFKFCPPNRKFGAASYSKVIASGIDIRFTSKLLKVLLSVLARTEEA
jgi:site-specific DNA-cytosine methylase